MDSASHGGRGDLGLAIGVRETRRVAGLPSREYSLPICESLCAPRSFELSLIEKDARLVYSEKVLAGHGRVVEPRVGHRGHDSSASNVDSR